ncbi:MAG: hypothetical protein FJ267_08815, partial [Planctomycetes bacterium]|nr:hypothetical protein [Planctomycetota bacterium]
MSTEPEDDTINDSFWDQIGEPASESGLDSNSDVESFDWSGDELEQAYQRAIEVLEQTEIEFPPVSVDDSGSTISLSAANDGDADSISGVTSNQSSESIEATPDGNSIRPNLTDTSA